MTSILLAFLKFVAIGITTVLGIVAVLTRTRDHTTEKITRGGWTLVAFMIASGAIAAVTQTVEMVISNKQQQADRRHRLQEFDALYSLLHPLRDLRVQINATYPMSMARDGFGNDWLRRVRQNVPQPRRTAVLNEAEDVLRPRGDVNPERAVFALLVEPEFDIGINRAPARAFHDELYFRTTKPESSKIYIHFDEGKVDSQIVAEARRLKDARKILSWRDLYGAEVIVYIPVFAPPGTEFTRFSMTFLADAEFEQPIEIPLTKPRTRPGDYRLGYSSVLTERELGPKPQIGE